MGGDTVYYGWGTTEEGYIKYAKKYYIFRELAWAVIICTLYSYFICICGRYATALKLPKEKAEKKAWLKMKESKRRAQEDLDTDAKDRKAEEKEKKKAERKKKQEAGEVTESD